MALAARQALAGGGAALEASARKLALRTGHLAEALYLAETAAVDEVAAEQLTRFFFGDEMADEVVRQNWVVLPECTGVWWKWKEQAYNR